VSNASHRRSEYLEWTKRRRDAIRHSLVRSGAPRLDLRALEPALDFLLTIDDHENGWLPLTEVIAERAGISASHVALANACTGANHLAFALFLEPGDHVVMETPVYEPLVRVAGFLGATVDFFERHESNAWRIDPDEVKRKLSQRTRLVVMSNLHNPTGAYDEDETIRRIAADAEKHDAHVVIDEVYLEFLYSEGVRSAVRLAPNILTTNSMTKAFGLDSLRLGWVLAEPALAEKARGLNDLFSNNISHPSERLAWLALSRADEILARAREVLDLNIDTVDSFVRSQPALSWVRPRAGTCGLVRADGIDVDELTDRLQHEFATGIVPGRFFNAPGYFRVAWGVDADALAGGLATLGAAIGPR